MNKSILNIFSKLFRSYFGAMNLIVKYLRFISILICVNFFCVNAYADSRGGNGGNGGSSGGELVLAPQSHLSDFPNEYISIQARKVKLKYEDVVIPGNAGMDIVVTREQSGSRVNIQSITIKTSNVFASEDALVSTTCLAGFKRLQIVSNGSPLSRAGFKVGDIPNSVIAAFDDYSYISCDTVDNTKVVLHKPDGRKYYFVKVNTYSTDFANGDVYKLSKIIDRHGNNIIYTYEDNIASYLNDRLKKITRNDGQIVNFTYDNETGKLKEITYSNKKVQYSYVNGLLKTFTDAEGRETKYEYGMYTGIGLQITKITTPEGLIAEYTHSPLIDNGSMRLPDSIGEESGGTFSVADFGYSGGNLVSKKISGSNIDTRHFYYHNTSGLSSTKLIVIESNEINNRKLATVYTIAKGSSLNQSGQLINIKHYEGEFVLLTFLQNPNQNTKLLYQQDNSWTAVESGDVGCISATRVGYADLECGNTLWARSSSVLKINNINGYDDYISTITSFDTYGQPHITSDNFDDNIRITTQSYDHDVENWILNQPRITKVGSELTSLTNVKEITYYSKTHDNYPFLPKEEKSFGIWQKKYSGYDSNGNVSKVEYNKALTFGDTSLNGYESFSNYKRGKPQTITVPKRTASGVITRTQVVDDEGLITSSSDFNGNVTTYAYDAIGRIKSISPQHTTGEVDWLSTLYTWTYDGGTNSNQPVLTEKRCTLDTTGAACTGTAKLTKKTTFDSKLNQVAIEASDGLNTIYQNIAYNVYNKPTFQSYPSHSAGETEGVHYTYDGLQRQLTQIQDNGGTITNEYLAGNKIKVTDAEDNVTTTTYLAYGSSSYQQATKIVSPENVTTDIAVNIFGNVTSIKQSGKNGSTNISQTEYRAYDSQQNLCQIKRNDVGATVMSRNTIGEVVWQAQGQTAASNTACNTTAAASHKVSFTYDNLGQQRTISYGDGTPTRTFTRDNNGNIKSIVGDGFTQAYNYNSLNLLEDETLTVSGRSGNMTLDYGYDSLGHLSSLQYPDGLAKINFAPNAFGQPTQAIRTYSDATTDVFVKGGTSKATYHPNGSVNTFTYGNNVVHTTTLNNRQMPSQIADKYGSADRVNLSYTYDDNSNITSIINTREAGIYSLSALTYDGLDRLVTTTGGSGIGSSAITYDGLGNIRTYSNSSAFSPSNLTYSYKSNFLLNDVKTTGTSTKIRDFSATNSYDARGNVLKNGNSEGKNTFGYNLANQMISAGGVSNDYVYDGYNRRVKTIDSKGTSYSFYNQAGKLMYRETASGGINYIFLGSKLIAKEGTGVKSSSDSIMNYKPFGDSIETPKDDVGYTGHKFDTDLGLSYMQARYYDPVIGRFYSNDPVGTLGHRNIAHGFNRYAYANNNPYKYTDPTGEIPLVVVAIWVLKEVGGEVFEQTTGIPAPTVKNVAKYGMKKAMKQSIKNRKKIEGVYKFKEGDQEYIGQSKDVMKRIKQHASNKDKFAKDKAGTLETKEVKGGKLEREKTEQGMIDDATGGHGAASDKVSNKVNPCRRKACS